MTGVNHGHGDFGVPVSDMCRRAVMMWCGTCQSDKATFVEDKCHPSIGVFAWMKIQCRKCNQVWILSGPKLGGAIVVWDEQEISHEAHLV